MGRPEQTAAGISDRQDGAEAKQAHGTAPAQLHASGDLPMPADHPMPAAFSGEERSMGEVRRRCRKCLLRELDQDAYFKTLHQYIEGLEESVRAEAGVYEKRLSVCRECDLLLEGMCRACGCFVELRAAIAVRRCPYDRW